MTVGQPCPADAGAAGRPDLLEAILGATRRAVEHAERRHPRAVLERYAAQRSPRGGAFREALLAETMPVIAECKRRSPSAGVLRVDYDAAVIAAGYERAGAAAVSVLTEPAFFDGALEHLARVRDAVAVPVLRKDFLVSAYQVVEARAHGADAVLLIVAALDDEALRELLTVAGEMELAALVEVHDREELERAVAAGADVIGVNNRNLRTLEVDIEASQTLVAHVPADVVAVAESGLRHGRDLAALRQVGYDAFLVGEALMAQANPGRALRALRRSAGRVPRGVRPGAR